jgi:hypothetical protein
MVTAVLQVFIRALFGFAAGLVLIGALAYGNPARLTSLKAQNS